MDLQTGTLFFLPINLAWKLQTLIKKNPAMFDLMSNQSVTRTRYLIKKLLLTRRTSLTR